MNHINKRWLLVAAFGGTMLVIGAAGGWWWSQLSITAMGGNTDHGTATGRGKVLYWYDPMYPRQKFDEPGKSPFMDMDLVPKYADGNDVSGGIKINPTASQNLGMRLAPVTRIAQSSRIDATAIVGFDERDVAVVQSRAAGFVERVAPLAPGDMVKAGQILIEARVPEWFSAQHEFLALRSVNDAAMQAAARDRLRSLGMSERTIRAVESSGQPTTHFAIVAPIGGVVQSLDARDGMTLVPGQTLARINGLATVWLEVAVPEALAGRVRSGNKATVVVAGNDRPLSGRVTAIVPVLNEVSRSLRVRVELPNHEGRLHPGMSAQVSLDNASSESALTVPSEAVMRTGKRALVMVATANGGYVPTEVRLGDEIGDRTVIAAGLSEDQQVVASGQFLIDSEASLKGIVAKSLPPAMPLHEADARIVAIGEKEITLTHGPFKTLSMPGMTMSFALGSGVAQGFKEGDRVRVGVRETDDGLLVEHLRKLEGKAP